MRYQGSLRNSFSGHWWISCESSMEPLRCFGLDTTPATLFDARGSLGPVGTAYSRLLVPENLPDGPPCFVRRFAGNIEFAVDMGGTNELLKESPFE